MKKNSTGLFCFLLIILINFQTQPVFKKLTQLSGTWRTETAGGTLYETWSLNKPNEMIGRTYTLTSSDTVLMENMQLAEKNSDVFYIPAVLNQNDGKPVPFKLISAKSGQFVFENNAHDFPQQIVYHLVGKDSVHAWIVGIKAGRKARMDYFYSRISK